MSKKEQQHRDCQQGTGLHRKSNAGSAHEPEKVVKTHIHIARKEDRCGISYQRSRTLQIAGDCNGNNQRNRIGFQLSGNRKADRCHHQDRCDVVHKSRNHAREYREHNRSPLNGGNLLQQFFGHEAGHSALDKQLNRRHGTGQHHQNIPVDCPDSLRRTEDARQDKQQCCSRRNDPALICKDQQQDIHCGKHYQSQNHGIHMPSFSAADDNDLFFLPAKPVPLSGYPYHFFCG